MSSPGNKSSDELYREEVLAEGSWITKDFIEGVLRGEEGSDSRFRVVDVRRRMAVGIGDNYLSLIYNTEADLVEGKTGRKERRTLIVKGLPIVPELRMFAEHGGVFRKELYMYEVCLPSMREMMEEFMPEEDFIAPASLKCNLPNVLVMEDLGLSGFKMAERCRQMDFAHAVACLRTLARLHALSYALLKKRPEIKEEEALQDFYSEKKDERLYASMRDVVKLWIKFVAELDSAQRFLPLLEKVADNLIEKIMHVVKPRDGTFSTINHGDLWVNNCMFKYDQQGSILRSKFVDFQYCRYTSPALDLHYMFFTSVRAEVLSERFSDLIEIYHGALVSDMERLRLDKSEMPSLEDIRGEMKERSIMALFSIITTLTITVGRSLDPQKMKDSDMAEQLLMENWRTGLRYQQILVEYLTICERMGYLESASEFRVPGPS